MNYVVRMGKDVDPYVRRLGSGHIINLRGYCGGIAQRILRIRARGGAAPITRRVNLGMLQEPAYHRFRKLGFHFVLNERPNQPANARKREFILNFASKPRFKPEDMPERLRSRDGAPLTARPRRKRGNARIASTIRVREIMNYLLYKNGVTAVASLRFSARILRLMALKLRRRLRAVVRETLKYWRRRPRVAFWPRRFNGVLTRVREPLDYAPLRAWLEPRQFESSGLPLLLNVLASNEPPIDWDAFPFGEPPEESERLPV